MSPGPQKNTYRTTQTGAPRLAGHFTRQVFLQSLNRGTSTPGPRRRRDPSNPSNPSNRDLSRFCTKGRVYNNTSPITTSLARRGGPPSKPSNPSTDNSGRETIQNGADLMLLIPVAGAASTSRASEAGGPPSNPSHPSTDDDYGLFFQSKGVPWLRFRV